MYGEESDIDLALVGEDLDIDELYLPYKFDLITYSRIENRI